MKAIGKVSLGMTSDMEVLVKTNVSMSSPDDIDDLYFVMFNIMAPDPEDGGRPLRLAIATVGCFFDLLQQQGVSATQIEEWIKTDPQAYLSSVADHYSNIVEHGEEKVSIPLSSQEDANRARAVLAALIDKGYYLQLTRYKIPGQEIIERSQQVPTEQLIPDLKTMLEVVKQWEDFDMERFLKELGMERME